MPQYSYLTADSTLFWLVALIGAGIIFIGARFIITPMPAARDFGVPASENEKATYMVTKGTRDIVSGLLAIGLLLSRATPGIVAGFLFIASLIPFGDMVNVYIHARRNITALLIHGGTAVFMCILAALILRR